jgi:acetyl-CoA carboxylase carboxyltransferase component
MGSKQAASTLLDVNISALKRAGKTPDAEEMEELRAQVSQAYETCTDIRYAASRLWVDGIIMPAETRSVLIRTLRMVTRHAADEPFRTGVYQV